ncbi:MAG TPA: hypothetical protein VEC36_02405 [Patescibacteria group bacterium]|nr:hypothetical protein [Patescibacteria group bacterium]
MEITSENLIHYNQRLTHSDVAPVRIYQELAEYGLLFDFLTDFMADAFENDEEFRKEMYRIMLAASLKLISGLEFYMLQDLSKALSYFNTVTQSCRQPKLSDPI